MKLSFIPVLAIASFISYSALDWIPLGLPAYANNLRAPDNGTPDGQRTPGGTRRRQDSGSCKPTPQPLTALIPVDANGSTTVEYPIFWFYIPYTSQDVKSIEFSLHNRDDKKTLYRTVVQLTKTPGIIAIPLPANPEHSLKLNESYHWYFTVKCQSQESLENDIVLDGWVKREPPNSDLWYDKLTKVAKRYLAEPQNPEVKKAWTNLLQSVGLQELAQAPMVD